MPRPSIAALAAAALCMLVVASDAAARQPGANVPSLNGLSAMPVGNDRVKDTETGQIDKGVMSTFHFDDWRFAYVDDGGQLCEGTVEPKDDEGRKFALHPDVGCVARFVEHIEQMMESIHGGPVEIDVRRARYLAKVNGDQLKIKLMVKFFADADDFDAPHESRWSRKMIGDFLGDDWPSHEITASSSDDELGMVRVLPPRERVPEGAAVVVMAHEFGQHRFDEWTGDAVGDRNPLVFRATEDREIVGVFQEFPFVVLNVAVTGTGTGDVDGTPIPCATGCTVLTVRGAVANLEALPDADSVFEGWTGCDEVNGTECRVDLDTSRSVTVEFRHQRIPKKTDPLPGPGDRIPQFPLDDPFGR